MPEQDLPDLRQWSISSEEPFNPNVILAVSKYSTADPLKNQLALYPWLATFTDPSSSFEDAELALKTDWNKATLAILTFDTVLHNTIITVRFQDHMRKTEWIAEALQDRAVDPMTAQFQDDSSKTSPNAFSEGLPKTEDAEQSKQLDEGEIQEMKQKLAQTLQECDQDAGVKAFQKGVARFCLGVGLAEAGSDVKKNIAALRTLLNARNATSSDETLRKEVDRLRELTGAQQRIITNLTYRHLMEHLPNPPSSTSGAGPKVGPFVSSTQQWQTFFKTALNRAKQSQTHPLHSLLSQFPQRSWAQLERVGADLYGTVSANIHHFQGEYNISSDQWGAMEGAILKALTPTQFDANGSVDWKNEAARY